MSEGTTHPLPAGLHVVEDPSHPQLYLVAETAELGEDPNNPKFYLIGS
ncbi:hypothetical protein J2X01_000724 [Arthrobacter ginsengisoli]|uniref:Uncharacterized protein n=1 Tax=Arthrobacter ginsengisoli TaxID=1356565 RepID=A0ABU1U8B6_9MICC|nr:hypothetical protein [Arthrobacter ginsengisoli]MDR7081447.1 hypothetical protein [Arthrobacter ginsengisoli]